MYLLMAVLGLHCWVDFSLVMASEVYSSCCRLLIVVASLAADHRL